MRMSYCVCTLIPVIDVVASIVTTIHTVNSTRVATATTITITIAIVIIIAIIITTIIAIAIDIDISRTNLSVFFALLFAPRHLSPEGYCM